MSTRRRVFLTSLTIVVALPLAGALYQALSVWRESRRFPPPGRLITVSGAGEGSERRLHLVCLGQGEPTVIFEAGGFGGALSAAEARQEVSALTRVCSYSRMGMGWSDPGPGLISVGMLADDLEHLTVQAGLRPPFILVPASFGGLTAELFARRHPDQVAGLVFVDAANSDIIERFATEIPRKSAEAVCLLPMAARLGLLRAADPLGLRKLSSDEASQSIAFLYRVEPMDTFCGVARGIQTSQREFAAAPPLTPDVPLSVLVHEKPDGLLPPGLAAETRMVDREWLGLQQRFAARSRRGIWRVVPGSDHLMFNRQPHAVASAVIEMLAEVRQAR